MENALRIEITLSVIKEKHNFTKIFLNTHLGEDNINKSLEELSYHKQIYIYLYSVQGALGGTSIKRTLIFSTLKKGIITWQFY